MLFACAYKLFLKMITGNVTTCQEGENTTHLKYYIVWLLVGQFLNGVAGGTLWVLGVTFLEMSTHAKNVSAYVGMKQ